MKKAKDLSLTDIAFTVRPHDIEKHSIKSLAKTGELIKIEINHNTMNIDRNAVNAKSEFNTQYFFNLEDAQIQQAIMREEYIASKFAAVQKASEEYNNAILEFFNKPLSNPLENN